MKKYQRSSRRESRYKGSASSFSEKCYVLFSPALLYRQNILRCTFNIARCTQHVHCYHALDQHGFSLPCILSAFSKHHPPPPVTMHKLSMATRCHACTQHFSNITDKHPPVTIHNLHMTTSSQLVAISLPCLHSAFFKTHRQTSYHYMCRAVHLHHTSSFPPI